MPERIPEKFRDQKTLYKRNLLYTVNFYGPVIIHKEKGAGFLGFRSLRDRILKE